MNDRQNTWPELLPECTTDNEKLEELDESVVTQVRLDVNRSFSVYPVPDNVELLRPQLLDLITTVLRNTGMCYYQGYHDVAQVVLLVFGSAEKAAPFLTSFSKLYLRDYMMPKLRPSLDQLNLITPLLTLADPYLGKLLQPVGPPFYALSSIITLFSHHVQSLDKLNQIFDYILESRTPRSIIYIYVAIVMRRKKQLKEVDDVDMVHSLLNNIAEDELADLPEILTLATWLQTKYKLDKMMKPISKYSCLREQVMPVDQVIKQQVIEAEKMNDFDPPELPPLPRTATTVSPALLGVSVAISLFGVLMFYQDRLRLFKTLD